MNKTLSAFVVAIPLVPIFAGVAVAQPQAQDKIPVKLQFVVSTYDKDRKVSSIPYTLSATANGGQVNLLNGTNVPIQSGDGKISYTNIGENITCTVTTEAGYFKIAISFDEKTLIPIRTTDAASGATARPADTPSFRDVNYNGTITIRDGETKELISAPDRNTGETVKVEITLTLEPTRRASIDFALPFSLN